MKNRSDFIVSAIVALCSVVLLAALLAAVGGFNPWRQPAMTFTVDFRDITGLGNRSEVFYAGSRVGHVQRIEFLGPEERLRPDMPVRAHISIMEDVPITADVRASISAASILGESHLALVSRQEDGERLADGARLMAVPGGGLIDQVLPGGESLVADIRELVSSLRSVTAPLSTGDAGRKLAVSLDNLEVLTSDLRRVVQGTPEDPGVAERLLAAVGQIEDAAGGLQQMVRGAPGQPSEGLDARLGVIAGNLDDFSRELNLMVSGSGDQPGLRQRLDAVTADLQGLLGGVRGESAGLSDVVQKVDLLVDEMSAFVVWGQFVAGTLAGRPNRLVFGSRENTVPTKQQILDHLRRTKQPFPVEIEEINRPPRGRRPAPAAGAEAP